MCKYSKKDLKSKLNLQRKEYETIIKRHLTFIDKLLSEKDDLSKKCETLTEEVKSMEKQFKEKVLEEDSECIRVSDFARSTNAFLSNSTSLEY